MKAVPHSLQRRLLSGGLWAIAAKLLFAASGLAINAILARTLGPEAFGSYVLIVSIVSAAVIAAQLGLQRVVVRLVAEYMAKGEPSAARGTVTSILKIGLLAAGVAALFSYNVGCQLTAAGFNNHQIVGACLLVALWLVIRSMHGLAAESFRGFHDIRLAAMFNGTIPNLLLLALLSAAVLSGVAMGLSRAVALSLLAWSVSGLLAFVLLFGRLRTLPSVGTEDHLGNLRIGLPLAVTGLTIFSVNQADLWIVGAHLSQEEVGLYGAATRLLQIVTVTMLIIQAVIPPIITELYASNQRARLQRITQLSALAASVPAAGTVVVFVFFGEEILSVVYGADYSRAALVLVILSVGQMFVVLGGSGTLVLMMTGHQLHAMIISLGAAVVLVLGALWVIDQHGMRGVALVTASVAGLQAVANLLWTRRLTGIWTHAVTCVSPSRFRELACAMSQSPGGGRARISEN